MIVLGVDPGGRHTGLVARRGRELLGFRLSTRMDDDIRLYIDQVLADATDLWGRHDDGVDLVAIEDLVDPTPQMGVTSVRGLIDTATVLGAVVAWAQLDGPPAAELVRPGGHGSVAAGLGRAGLLAAYPAHLVGDREDAGAGRLTHCRSAWDIAGVAAAAADAGR